MGISFDEIFSYLNEEIIDKALKGFIPTLPINQGLKLKE